MAKNKKIKKAGGFLYAILRAIFRPYLFFRYGLRFDRTVSKKIKKPCIIVSNHASFHDQFIVGLGFNFAMNFVASDSLFRVGKVRGWLLRNLARPIPIAKGSSDPAAIKSIMSIIHDGGSVALFPEGNRTFFGATSHFKPAIGKLVKKLGVPLVIVNIRGGYNTDPRWRHNNVSRGKMTASVTRVVSPEELSELSGDDINYLIAREIDFNEFEYNAEKKIVFKGKRKAEYLEAALFVCPQCGKWHDLHSRGNEFYCSSCGARVKINGLGFFEKVENADAVPDTILECGKIQLDAVKNRDYSQFADKPVFSDVGVKVHICERAKREKLLSKGTIALYSDRITAGEQSFAIDEISDMAIQSIRKLQIYMHDGSMYMIEAPEKTNLLKYMVCGYHLIHKLRGEEDEYFGY